jgi:MFS family permease
MGILTYGYDSAFIGTTITLKGFERDFGLSKMSKAEQANVSSNLTSIYSAGGFFGALFMFFSLELLGRKMTIIISNAIFILGAILTVAPIHLGTMYAGRLLTGFGVGGFAAVSPIYTSEMAPPAIRGRLTGFFESFYQVGAVIGFWINYGISHNLNVQSTMAWRIPFGVQLIPAGLLIIGIPFLKESPVWLLKKDRSEEAIKVYSYIRKLPADHHYIAEDVAFIRGQIEYERAVTIGGQTGFWAFLKGAGKEACMKGMRNRFALVFIMFMWQAWSGAAAINYCELVQSRIHLHLVNILRRFANYFHIHRPCRLHSLDWCIRCYQGRRIGHLLHLVH